MVLPQAIPSGHMPALFLQQMSPQCPQTKSLLFCHIAYGIIQKDRGSPKVLPHHWESLKANHSAKHSLNSWDLKLKETLTQISAKASHHDLYVSFPSCL